MIQKSARHYKIGKLSVHLQHYRKTWSMLNSARLTTTFRLGHWASWEKFSSSLGKYHVKEKHEKSENVYGINSKPISNMKTLMKWPLLPNTLIKRLDANKHTVVTQSYSLVILTIMKRISTNPSTSKIRNQYSPETLSG
jgi:hypothetical protein